MHCIFSSLRSRKCFSQCSSLCEVKCEVHTSLVSPKNNSTGPPPQALKDTVQNEIVFTLRFQGRKMLMKIHFREKFRLSDIFSSSELGFNHLVVEEIPASCCQMPLFFDFNINQPFLQS